MTARSILVLLVFASTLTLRVRGIDTNFWLLRDQIRDWEIALRPFQDLPLVGPATHVGGYTIGPAFYWILWLIRVTIGPWFEYLPHAGGIGQAILQSAADALLCVALWRRTDSIPIAAATVILFATAPFDLRLSSLIWNPVMGTTLAKAATALVLLGWYRGSLLRAALLAVVAWSAVHAYTGAVFVTLGVFAVMVAGPWIEGERHTARRNLLTVVAVVALLQVPYAIYRVMEGSRNPAMGAVTHGVMRVLSGGEPPHVLESLAGYSSAVNFILVSPWTIRWSSWVLLACAGIVAFRYRRDAAVLGVVLMPQVAALAGYAFFLDDLDDYYYLSLIPAAVMTVVLGITAVIPKRSATAGSLLLLLGAMAIVPVRVRVSQTLFQMPEYGVLVDASRRIAALGQPMRAIATEFRLPPTADPTFVFRILGGRIDRGSPWVATIERTGSVTYRKAGAS